MVDALRDSTGSICEHLVFRLYMRIVISNGVDVFVCQRFSWENIGTAPKDAEETYTYARNCLRDTDTGLL